MAPVQCPVCDEPMIVLEYDAVEVDYCVACEGVWLDAGELDLLFGDPEACAAFLSIGSPTDAAGEKPRICPACDAKMTKEGTESVPPVLFDHCPNGHGLWFDKGEVGAVLAHAEALGAECPVPEFLKDVFSEEEADPPVSPL
jgi:Zn-finger nucleic acid-binding protein